MPQSASRPHPAAQTARVEDGAPSCVVVSSGYGGFAEAVSDGVIEAAGGWERAEDGIDAALVEIAQAGEEVVCEGCWIVPISPVEKISSGHGDPAARKHEANLFASFQFEVAGVPQAEL